MKLKHYSEFFDTSKPIYKGEPPSGVVSIPPRESIKVIRTSVASQDTLAWTSYNFIFSINDLCMIRTWAALNNLPNFPTAVKCLFDMNLSTSITEMLQEINVPCDVKVRKELEALHEEKKFRNNGSMTRALIAKYDNLDHLPALQAVTGLYGLPFGASSMIYYDHKRGV